MAEFKLNGYVEVKDRIKAFLEDETKKGWHYETNIVQMTPPKGASNEMGVTSELGFVAMKTTIYNEQGTIKAIGHAQEVEGVGMVNKTSYFENCETSAIGRALGMLGYGIDKSIASKDEIDRAKAQNEKPYEVFTNINITMFEAKQLVATSITDLLRKIGGRKADLDDVYSKSTLGGNLKEASLKQLLNVEKKLRTANNESSDWFELYGKNSRIKDHVDVNQEIVYMRSQVRFGLKAYELAENDAIKLEVLDAYSEFALEKYIEQK